MHVRGGCRCWQGSAKNGRLLAASSRQFLNCASLLGEVREGKLVTRLFVNPERNLRRVVQTMTLGTDHFRPTSLQHPQLHLQLHSHNSLVALHYPMSCARSTTDSGRGVCGAHPMSLSSVVRRVLRGNDTLEVSEISSASCWCFLKSLSQPHPLWQQFQLSELRLSFGSSTASADLRDLVCGLLPLLVPLHVGASTWSRWW